MMYAFGARSDFAIWDEPFYAPYLALSGQDHPMRNEILAMHEADPNRVAARCIDPNTGEKPHFYMKHMPHHMIEGIPLDWAHDCINVHLIRHPARVIASYGAKRDEMTADDLGFRQQAELFNRFGGVVIDSFDIRENPEHALKGLCQAIDLEYENSMLSWPSGGRQEDGVWAKHWYGAIHQSTGFAGPEGPVPALSETQTKICDEVMPYYKRLYEKRLRT